MQQKAGSISRGRVNRDLFPLFLLPVSVYLETGFIGEDDTTPVGIPVIEAPLEIPGRFAQFISPDHFLPSVEFAKGYLAQCLFSQSIYRPTGIIHLRIREVRFKCVKRQSICQIAH